MQKRSQTHADRVSEWGGGLCLVCWTGALQRDEARLRRDERAFEAGKNTQSVAPLKNVFYPPPHPPPGVLVYFLWYTE